MPSYGGQPLLDTTPRDRYPLAGALPSAPVSVEINLGLTHIVRRYYTQRAGLCVAFSACQALTFFNGRLYHPGWSFYKSGGDPNSGTSTAALMDVLRKEGNLVVQPPYPDTASEDDVRGLSGDIGEGIKENRWLSQDGAAALEDIRTTLSLRVPVLFCLPVYGTRSVDGRELWICPDAPTTVVGWHQICLTYASDAEGFIGSPNSWGDGNLYGFKYEELVKFVNVHHAYGTVITDTITGTEGSMPVDAPIPNPEPAPDPEPPRRKRRKRRRDRGRERNG